MSDFSEDATIAFDMVVTLDDQLRMTEYLWDQPRFRRRRLIKMAAIVVIGPIGGVLLGIALAWAEDRSTPFWALAAGMWMTIGWAPLAILPGCMIVLFALQRLPRRWTLRRRLRRILRERPGVDPSDPALGEPASCTFGPDGFTSEGVASTVRLQWPAIKALAETPGQIMVRTGELTGYIIPKRCLLPGQLEAIRAMAARRLVTGPGR